MKKIDTVLFDEKVAAERRDYWNEKYRDYWKQRVAETNNSEKNSSQLNQNDKLSSSDQIYFEAIQLLDIKPGATVLEMGCGFGRSIPFLQSIAGTLHAMDISKAMIEAARESCSHFENVKFHISEAENTPFDNHSFDYVVCFAVFDAVFQTKTLIEGNRLLKQGGRLLITGKNDNYFDDDEEGYIAEINARAKKHPNYFTDVAGLLKNLDQFGFQKLTSRFYLRRGDIPEGKFETELPQHFYEYFLVLEKMKSPDKNIDFAVGNPFSKTWHRKNNHE